MSFARPRPAGRAAREHKIGPTSPCLSTVLPSVATVAGWCGARATSTREPLLGMPVGACHAVPGRSVFPPLEPGAVRLSEITAFCRLAPRLLHEPRRTSGTVGGAHERLTPFIRLENCSKESVLQPQSPTIDVNCSSAPSTARTVLGLAHPSRPVCWMEPTSLPKPRRLHGRHVGYYTVRAAGSALPARR